MDFLFAVVAVIAGLVAIVLTFFSYGYGRKYGIGYFSMSWEAVSGSFALAHSRALTEAAHGVIDADAKKFDRVRAYTTWCAVIAAVSALCSIFVF